MTTKSPNRQIKILHKNFPCSINKVTRNVKKMLSFLNIFTLEKITAYHKQNIKYISINDNKKNDDNKKNI